MTKLVAGKAITRETCALERGAPLVVRLHLSWVEIWVKGTRQHFPVDYETVLALARKRAFERRRH